MAPKLPLPYMTEAQIERAEKAKTYRQLNIRMNVVRRLTKEEQSYKVEAKAQEGVLERLKAKGAEGADIRNAERVLKDTEQMIPRTQQSLEEAIVALEDLFTSLESDPEFGVSYEYKSAKSVLESAQAAPASNDA